MKEWKSRSKREREKKTRPIQLNEERKKDADKHMNTQRNLIGCNDAV